MKKSFLLCLMALFGVLGMYAAPASGDGTEANPYIVADGDTYAVGASQKVYIQVTTTSATTLTLTTGNELGYYPQLSYNITCDGVTNTFNTGFGNATATYQLEAGKTYTVWNNAQFASVNVTVGLEVIEDAITVTADPADGSTLEGITASAEGYPVKITTSKPVGFVAFTIADNKGEFRTSSRAHCYDIAVSYTRPSGEPVGEFYLGEQTSTEWELGPESGLGDRSTWTFYDDRTYALTIQIYNSQLDWEQGGAPIGSATITYNGSTPAIQYSTVKLIDIYPNPDLANPKDDHMMLNMAEGRNQAVLIFDGYIKRVEAGIAGGQGMGEMPVDGVQYIYNSDSEGNVKSTAVLLTIPSSTTINALTNVRVWDSEGRALWDENPAYGLFSTAANQYQFDFPVADGRVADYALEYTSVDPSTENVTALDKVTLTFKEMVSTYTDVHEGEGKVALYNEKDEKVADVAFSSQLGDPTDSQGSDESRPTELTMTFIEPGTLQITEAVYDDKTGELVTPYSETGTPVQLEGGVYTLRIAKESFKNGYLNEETPWEDGQQGHGVTNPEWEFTYNLVKSIPTFVSADPAPYDGETYNTELPTEVTVTFSEPVTIESASAAYGTNSRAAITEENITVDGNNVKFVLPAEALDGVSVSLIVKAVNAEGAPVTYGEDAEEGQMILTYQVNPSVMELTFDPADRSTVQSLKDILVTTDEQLGLSLTSEEVVVKNESGEVVTTGFGSWGNADGEFLPEDILNQAYIVFNTPVTEAGTYTVEFPAGVFMDMNMSVSTKAYTLTYTVDPTVGVENVEAVAAESDVEVYNLDGALVASGKYSEVKQKLAKGVYVVNNRKVVIR